MKGGYRRQVSLNYSFFSEVIPQSILVKEFQFTIFGCYMPARVKLQDALDEKLKEGLKNMEINKSMR